MPATDWSSRELSSRSFESTPWKALVPRATFMRHNFLPVEPDFRKWSRWAAHSFFRAAFAREVQPQTCNATGAKRGKSTPHKATKTVIRRNARAAASQRQNPHRTAHGFGGAGDDGVPRFSFPPAMGLRLAGFPPEISLELPILDLDWAFRLSKQNRGSQVFPCALCASVISCQLATSRYSYQIRLE